VPRILDRARKGRLALIGDGSNLIDTIYVDNAAAAHLLALDRLAPGAACAGKAYFLTNGDPRPMREILAGIVQAAGLPAPTRSVPPGLAWAVGGLLEAVYGLFGVKSEPPMTRFVASQLSTAHWFDISAIRRDLGYAPAISIDEGMARLAAALQG
jgi:nucleoside-diphosphate-sugar epimerase